MSATASVFRFGRFALIALGLAPTGSSTRAAVPGEVPPDVAFGADRVTLTWSAASGADRYDVYEGADPAAYDHACRVYRSAALSASIDDAPAPGGLLYFLVSGANLDGEGSLGADGDGLPRPNAAPCVDIDGDFAPDNRDNCAAVANASQADQDENGVGDACDPNTYEFEADAPGTRPAGMTQLGPLNQALTVKDVDGERGVSYDAAGVGTSDRFDRLDASTPFADTTVWVDVQDVPQVASLEMWSDGAYGWNAGTGVILQVYSDQSVRFFDRHAQSVPMQQGPAVPTGGRMRLRLIKGTGATSTLHVDAFDGSEWTDDYATFSIADDHLYAGRATVISDYFGGPRALKRITVTHATAAAPLALQKDYAWSTDWKVFQRDGSGKAAIPVRFSYHLSEAGTAQARVAPSAGGAALPGHDWSDHELALAPANAADAAFDVSGVPAGGNYDVQVRLVRTSDGAVLGQATLAQIAVGDVFIAGGQSNMSGYSGSLANAEAPIDQIHLFGNDYVWKRASEPMDDGTDQVDKVSAESPAHSMMLRFAKEIFQATGVPVGVIPGPLGGTNLYSQWQRNAAQHDDRGTLYGSLLHRVRAQQLATPPKGFLWYQGESDAGRGTLLYKQDLKTLMAQYREDLADPGLVFGIVQLATYTQSNLTTWIPIQEAQREVVEEDPLSVLAVPIDQPRADSIHLNVDGYKTLGVRMAREMREHFYGQAIDASARLTDVRIVGNNRSIELVYDRAVVATNAGLYGVTNAGTPVAVNSVSSSGSTVTLSLHARVDPGALVTYGYSRSPTAGWTADTAGTPVAIFQDVPAH